MKAYIGLWVSSIVITLTNTFLNLSIERNWIDDDDLKEYKIDITLQYTLFLSWIVSVSLDMVILAHYWRAGDKMRSRLAHNLTRIFTWKYD